METYIQYARDVLDGKVVAGEFVRLAAHRFFAFMDKYEFRKDKVDYVIRFFHALKHFTGNHAGKPFILLPWQQFVIASIYGFYKSDGSRLTKYVYIEIARKNGKTAFAAGMCLYHLIADGEMDAEVELAANSKEQAKIAFKFCSNFSREMDPSGRILIPYRDKVQYPKKLSLLQVLAADDSKLDGFNASMYLLDEYHAAKNSGLKDVLQSSQGMRNNPLGVVITTAGFDKLGPCYEYRTMCTEVLNGLKEDDSLFAAIYSMDINDDWKDETNWIKCNPNMDVTVKREYLKQQVTNAVNTPSDEVGVKTKNFNVWCDSEDVWIPDHYILDSSKAVDLNDYKDMDCYCGVDLSSTSDLTSVAFMIPLEDGSFVFKNKYYLPEVALTEKRFKELYGGWRRQKLITITPGNVTDYDFILNDLMDAGNIVNIAKVGYDQWNATQFVINAEARGLPMEPVSQSIGNFNRPTKELERLMLSGHVVLDNNVINRHCYRNVVITRDKNGNVKPSKQFEEKKIDGVIAEIMALGSYLSTPQYGGIY